MAWVSRTTRDNNKVGAPSSATVNIGPGSYSTDASAKARSSYAPFGSTDVRKFVGKSFVTPGPGTYTNSSNRSDGFGSSKGASVSFRSQTTRDQRSSKFSTPGPGSYVKRTAFVKPKVVQRSNSNRDGVRWVRVPTAPSIPTVGQSFGYEEGHNGQLVLLNPTRIGHSGRCGDTVGPGAYDVANTPAKVRAVNFAASKTTRSLAAALQKQADLPGPGQYASPESMTPKYQKASAAFQASGRDVKSKTRVVDRPGPGAYEPRSSLAVKKKPEHLQFFGSTQVRFEEQKILTAPGPGQYELCQSSLKESRSDPKHSVGFTSTQKRFDAKSAATEAADQFYDTPTLASELQSRLAGRTGAFGSTAKRFQEKARVADDPIHILEEDDEDDNNSPPKPSATFASKTTRFEKNNLTPGLPSPGTYEVSQEWINRRGQGILQSGSKRFNGTKTSSESDTLGPGSYNVSSSFKKPYANQKSSILSTEKRFKSLSKPLNTPGPGSYDSSIVYGDMNTPTYNITIAEEMERSLKL